MRSRYYNPDIKRFINQDVLIGSISNSNSLNRYSYVEGNPVSYTDPFGLSPYKWISLGIHTALDVAGIWFPVADVANAFYYLFEGKPGEFGKSLILAIPGSDFLNIGTKFSAKLGKYSKLSEGIVKGVNAAGHIGSAAIMAYETGSAIGKMIDKYLVYDNELSKETAVEVGLIVLGCYGTAKYSDILAKYMGGLGGSVRPAKVTGDAGGTSTKVVDAATESTSLNNTYYFRGTTEGYAGNSALQRLEITPTSTDPLVATVFATHGEQYGKGVVYICSAEDLKGVSTTASNVLSSYEKEVCFNMQPLEYASRSSISISALDARTILGDMGYTIPSGIARENISPFLSSAPTLSDDEIVNFIIKVGGMQ